MLSNSCSLLALDYGGKYDNGGGAGAIGVVTFLLNSNNSIRD